MTNTERLAQAARALLAAASEPITFPMSPGSDALVLVPATYLDTLRTALVITCEPDDCTPIEVVAPPVTHPYAQACTGPRKGHTCVCAHPVDANGRRCFKSRADPIHEGPPTEKDGAS